MCALGPGSGGCMEPRDVVVVGGSAGSVDRHDDAGQQASTADWAARLAESLRAQIEDTPGR